MRQFQGMKPLRSTIYLFTCGNADFKGFSLHQDGANLPTLCGAPERSWRFVRAIPMSTAALRPFAGDVQVAFANLETRGYHISHNTDAVTRHQNSATGLASAEIPNARCDPVRNEKQHSSFCC